MDILDPKMKLVADIINCKLEILLLKKKRRILTEELFRQHVEGEFEPIRRSQRLLEMSSQSKSKKQRTKSSEMPSDTTAPIQNQNL